MGEKDHAISLLYYDNQATFTLTKFEEAQSRQANYAKEKLAKLRVKVLEIVKGACESKTASRPRFCPERNKQAKYTRTY